MAHDESSEHLTSEQKKFNFYMTRGEDFLRIDIYRNARKYFQMALDMGMDNEKVQERLDLCTQMIKKERKSFIGLGIAVCIIIAVVLVIRAI